MTPAQRAMATWLGTLQGGGVVQTDAIAGEMVAAYVVGIDAVRSLRAWFANAAEADVERERRAAIEACILMAHADREVQREERDLLQDIVAKSGLGPDARRELEARVSEPGPLEGLEERLTQPVLRELIVALAWELALADERIDPAEATFFERLADVLDVPAARAEELRAAISERVG